MNIVLESGIAVVKHRAPMLERQTPLASNVEKFSHNHCILQSKSNLPDSGGLSKKESKQPLCGLSTIYSYSGGLGRPEYKPALYGDTFCVVKVAKGLATECSTLLQPFSPWTETRLLDNTADCNQALSNSPFRERV